MGWDKVVWDGKTCLYDPAFWEHNSGQVFTGCGARGIGYRMHWHLALGRHFGRHCDFFITTCMNRWTNGESGGFRRWGDDFEAMERIDGIMIMS
jgi:hypothetical protein